MPSALQQSRDILARGVARIRSGLSDYERRQRSPGPEIAVEPFDRQNVSTPAALLKLGTSVAAARRSRANYEAAREAAREGLALEREKTRAEIARLRAQGEYYQQRGAAEAAPDQPKPLTPYQEQSLNLRKRAIANSEAAQAARERRAGRVTAARSELSQIDAEVNRITDAAVNQRVAAYERYFQRVNNPDPLVRAEAVTKIGIDPAEWEKIREFPATYIPFLEKARAGLKERASSRIRALAQQRFGPARERALSIIQQGEQGFPENPENPLDLELEDDPLNLFSD